MSRALGVSAVAVQRAATEDLVNIDHAWALHCDARIEREFAKRTGFFTRRPLHASRTEAMKAVARGTSMCDPYDYAKGWGTRLELLEVLKLCSWALTHGDHEIALSSEHAEMLGFA